MRPILTMLCLLAAPAIRAAEPPLIGDAVAPLSLPALDGKTIGVAPGRVTIVDFSATWCSPCHDALDALLPLATKLAVDLVIVDVGEPASIVRRFYATRPMPPSARVGLDVDGAAAATWGQHRFPTTFVIDRSGVIRFINRGYGPGYAARIEARTSVLTH